MPDKSVSPTCKSHIVSRRLFEYMVTRYDCSVNTAISDDWEIFRLDNTGHLFATFTNRQLCVSETENVNTLRNWSVLFYVESFHLENVGTIDLWVCEY
jgi:hypothetical protein